MADIPVTHELFPLNKQSNITQLLSIQELLQSLKTHKRKRNAEEGEDRRRGE